MAEPARRIEPLVVLLSTTLVALLDARMALPPDTPAAGLADSALRLLEAAWCRGIDDERDVVAVVDAIRSARRIHRELAMLDVAGTEGAPPFTVPPSWLDGRASTAAGQVPEQREGTPRQQAQAAGRRRAAGNAALAARHARRHIVRRSSR